jgi:hypothetical protein
MEIKIGEKKALNLRERAYLMDKLCRTSYYVERFGELDEKTEKQLIVSIFLKLQEA